ncbi:hypothetical protein [Bifidobacterium imperatoris]|uniref:Cell division protein FtsL n=1 Tax=Bifidobacterium imperatoris TaxID=2020965 RepID=A0A2N5ITB3_9BIFI|nr:hypothetical protein [Bifidobacterium imperatoris]PLS25202.1 hypothetical protein Tam1G_0768 [Bifidobacterium imperatoris]
MAATARSIRSGSSASQRPQAKPQASSRPQLRVITNAHGDKERSVFGRVLEWTRTRTAPMVHVIIAVVFLAATLLGALMLRTEMVQNSFEAAEVKSHINVLTQDIEDDQAKLDQLIASLPDKASEMGMVSKGGTATIDLQGYQQPKDAEGGTQ